jgi:hypothetical protein
MQFLQRDVISPGKRIVVLEKPVALNFNAEKIPQNGDSPPNCS